MIWTEDGVRSQFCVRQFRGERDLADFFAGTPVVLHIREALTRVVLRKSYGDMVIGKSVALMHARSTKGIVVRQPSFQVLDVASSSTLNNNTL